MPNKSSLENILKAVLSVAATEQNAAYPPFVFERHFNIVTSFLLDAGAQIYPEKVDVFLPFIEQKKIPVTNGYVQLPEEYRNLLGAPSIQANKEGKDCSDAVIIDTPREFELSKLKAGCKTYSIQIVDKSEWDDLTTSKYAYPTFQKPIGLFIGERRIKVCPHDLVAVEVTYLKKEKIYRYGYITQPDDTFIFDATTSIESEWLDPAFKPLFKGCLALYSAFCQDRELKEFHQILQNSTLF